ncbi:hypothetical protein EMPG_12582 [Blastomyces silverae]|uniref:Uncharacterized protein n=1 Tax=Blastomyces silverae TaxID=2060906 RepID=A0A0H1BTD2_9EURO|nr:hypothetical protein EMPG_12582 [Blastomyces silverae]
MPPATRSGQKATDRTAQVGTGTESEANARGMFRNVGSKQGMRRRWTEGCKRLFSGDYQGRGQGTALWREQLGWEGEKPLRAIYHRYEAVGNPERKEDNSGTRFSWDVETGRWMHKSEWLKIKQHPGSGSSKREAKGKGSDEITGGIPITGVEGLRDNSHDIQALPMGRGDSNSNAGTDSGSLTHCPYGVILTPEEGPGEKKSAGEQSRAGPKEPAEVEGQRADASVASPEIHRRRRGVALGANPVPKPGERDAKAEPVTQRKCALKTTITLPLEIATGGNQAINREVVADGPRANRGRQPQQPIADEEGLSLTANIAPEPDQRATELSKCGGTEFVAQEDSYGGSLDANHALLNAQGDAGESRRVLRSRSARRGDPEGVVPEMDSFPKQKKEPGLPESQGEKPHAQEAVVLAAAESGRASRWRHIAPKPREYPKRQAARITRSRKDIPDAAPVGIRSQSVPGEQIVASSAPEVQARSQTQDMTLKEGAEAPARMSRKRKREETSTLTQGEAPVVTEGRPKRTRRPPKWYEG